MCCHLIRWGQWHDPVSMWSTYPRNVLPYKFYQWIVTILHIASDGWKKSWGCSHCRFNHRLGLIVSRPVDFPSSCWSTHTSLHLIIEVTLLYFTGIYNRCLSTKRGWVHDNTPRSISRAHILSVEWRSLLDLLIFLQISSPATTWDPILSFMISLLFLITPLWVYPIHMLIIIEVR